MTIIVPFGHKEVAWGYKLSFDLIDCKPHLITNPKKMKKFVKQLCNKINMERHKHTWIERFGAGHILGYSLFQFIKTSNITIHFEENYGKQVMLDLFSCKEFDPEFVVKFTEDFFGGKLYKDYTYEPRGYKFVEVKHD